MSRFDFPATVAAYADNEQDARSTAQEALDIAADASKGHVQAALVTSIGCDELIAALEPAVGLNGGLHACADSTYRRHLYVGLRDHAWLALPDLAETDRRRAIDALAQAIGADGGPGVDQLGIAGPFSCMAFTGRFADDPNFSFETFVRRPVDRHRRVEAAPDYVLVAVPAGTAHVAAGCIIDALSGSIGTRNGTRAVETAEFDHTTSQEPSA